MNRNFWGAKNPNWRGGKVVKCALCGTRVWVKPSHQRKRNYCSRACLWAWLNAHGQGQESARWSGGNKQRKCKKCRKPFVAHRREINRGNGHYCSIACSAQGQRRRFNGQCEVCGVGFEAAIHKKGLKRFCSQACKRLKQIKQRTPEELIQRRLSMSMGSMMYQALKGKKAGRKWEELAGYTIVELMAHLESLFTDGMSWKNYGLWHIDHVLPRSSFRYTTAMCSQFKTCWALSNLQPLWKLDNLRKWAKLPPALETVKT